MSKEQRIVKAPSLFLNEIGGVSFFSLMKLYEKNYNLFQKLMTQLSKRGENSSAAPPKKIYKKKSDENWHYSLHLSYARQDEWTIDYHLKYCILNDSGKGFLTTLAELDFEVYLDSKQLAILYEPKSLHRYLQKNRISNIFERQWFVNYFLFGLLLMFTQRNKQCDLDYQLEEKPKG